ncbi:hypothetical protein BCV70DRAFT_200191 [Testicularia cyperi]|uniref:VWFA domain-containing protein n=1 Tax=Testicularia cyperi TaxID=1882483 RepID=A0A317XRP0_9BASI|nr:hypothetical protein BCV70DRAFT_200191 [Testicularia cyperi]
MGFNKKLVVAGLAVGVTAYMLYKASKKNQQTATAAAVPPHASNPSMSAPQQHGSSNSHAGAWGAAALGGAAVAAAGAAYGHHQSNQAAAPVPSPENPNLTWDSLRDWRHIANLLATCVMDQFLYPFYTFQDVARIAQHIASSGALAQCADAWQLPPYLAQDLVKLALFDVMFLLDDSASMRSEGTRRRDALAGILKRAADAAARFDPDGMEVAWMNSSVQQRIHNVQEADQLTSKCQYDGRATPMGHALETKIIQPLVLSNVTQGRLAKPALILVITDGRPTGSTEKNEKIIQVLRNAKAALASSSYGEDAVSFQIAAVGNDREAQEWLDSIDNDPTVGDLVDVCSDIMVESAQVKKSTGVELSQELYCLKLLLGGIDTSYDTSDENASSWSRSARKRRERKEQAKMQKEARHSQQMQAFKRDRDAALSGAAPVPSAGGALPPQPNDPSLSGYSHQPSYPPVQQGSPVPSGYPAPGAPQQPPYQQQAPYPPAQSSYGAPPPAPPSAGYPAPGGGQQQGYPNPAYSSYQGYGASHPGQAPPPYPDAFQQQQRGTDGGSSYPGMTGAPPAGGPGAGGAGAYVPGAGGFAMPTAQPGASGFPNPHQPGQQPQQPPFGFPQARPGGGGY